MRSHDKSGRATKALRNALREGSNGASGTPYPTHLETPETRKKLPHGPDALPQLPHTGPAPPRIAPDSSAPDREVDEEC